MQRRKSSAAARRPKRRGQARTHRTGAKATLWTVGPHVDRVRSRRRRPQAKAPVVLIPSDRWRPMRRVAGVPWEEQHHGEPRRVRVESTGPMEGQPVDEEAELVESERTPTGAASDEPWEIVDEKGLRSE